ncbi:MAG TPA: LptF/LptG family permease [bacterium]|jgi:lipopolysaccharide export system permease protein
MRLIDKYIASMVAMFVIAAVFSFAVLIVCNNFYASSELLFKKDIPFKLVAMINLLDAPATIVLSLPVASLFGVMLAIGQLGRSSEITAMRCGGISLLRIMVPVLFLSVLLSVMTYYMDERLVPIASEKAHDLKKALEGDKAVHLKQDVFLRNDSGMIIYAASFDTNTKALNRIQVLERENKDWIRITNAYNGRFEGDNLILMNGDTFLYDEKGEMIGAEEIRGEVAKYFPETLQDIHEETRDASTLAGGEIAEQIARSVEAGLDPVAYETDLQFKRSTPVACLIFSFVGFIFSVFSPRKEMFVGMLYAIILVLVYYVLISVFKSLGKQGIIPYPVISAWATNVMYLAFGIYIFVTVRR